MALQQPITPLQTIAFSDSLSTWENPRRIILCADAEGWGPLSRVRFDFTPCFLDATVIVWALLGLVISIVALRSSIRIRGDSNVIENVMRTSSSVIAIALVCTSISHGFVHFAHTGVRGFDDIKLWASVVSCLCFGSIAAVHLMQSRQRCNPTNGTSMFWLLTMIIYLVQFQSLLARHIYAIDSVYFGIFSTTLGLIVVQVFLLWVVALFLDARVTDSLASPLDRVGLASKLSYSWMAPLIDSGYQAVISEHDLWDLRQMDSSEVTGSALQGSWAKQKAKGKPSLWYSLYEVFSGQYLGAAGYKALNDLLAFAQPQLLRLLLDFVASYRSRHTYTEAKGIFIAIAMFAVALIQSISMNQYLAKTNETGMRVKAALIDIIHRRSMRLSNKGRSDNPTGSIINHVSVDTQRLQQLAQFGHQLWSAPLQLVLCLLSLYQLLGLSMLAGVAVMVLSIPLNTLIIKLMRSVQLEQMKNRDARTKMITEILANMKSIKLLGWQPIFMSKLSDLRSHKELKTLKQFGIAEAFANLIWSSTPFFVSCTSFVVYVLTQDAPLTAEIVFPTLVLFNLLSFPLAVLPMTISTVVEASIAVNRVKSFLLADSLQEDAIVWDTADSVSTEEVATIRHAKFSWDQEKNHSTLDIDEFVVSKGSLCCIVGRVGAGKSTLLQSLTGEVWKAEGDVYLRGSVAYVGQNAWMTTGTIKDNILFGHSWEADFYRTVIDACALQEDLLSLPNGDDTPVGGTGITLSGGQKARIALARALYARADVYLLDDCIAAVDQHVGRHLIDHAIGPNGMLGEKTRILATNSIAILKHSDHIVLLENGRITEQGTFQDAVRGNGAISSLIRSHSSQEDQRGEQNEDSDEQAKGNVGGRTSPTNAASPSVEHMMSENAPIAKLAAPNTSIPVLETLHVQPRSRKRKGNDEEVGVAAGSGKQAEGTSTASWNTYLGYAKASSSVGLCFYSIALLAAQTMSAGSDVWVKTWAEENGRYGKNRDVGMYIGVYAAFGVGAAILVMLKEVILCVFCSIVASKTLHDKMARAIFRSPMSFFETTASGAILNRFSADIYRVDEMLGPLFDVMFGTIVRTLIAFAIISAGTPPFLLALIPLGALYFWIQRYFVRTSRELKRLESETQSLSFTHIQSVLAGATTIRAMQQAHRFQRILEGHIDRHLRASFASICANRWISLRLEFIGSTSILVAACLAVIAVVTNRGPSTATIGLSLTYALRITSMLNSLVQVSVSVETNIVSVERVLEYTELPSEAADEIPQAEVGANWPNAGTVSFHNFSMRYRKELDDVLRNINFECKSGERIGIVGRTGAGKSSLILSLFRLTEATKGHIEIDLVNTSQISLQKLRSSLSIIPQDSAVFEGTIRTNLDPLLVHDDTELWSALDHAHLKDTVDNFPSKLDAVIHEGGSNLSSGQRQLISLARALLRNSPVLVLDEATAAVDLDTDKLLQETLRSSLFANRTIITIAHRIKTVLDYDKILVLSKGEVAEFGSPKDLLGKKALFYELVREAGLDVKEEGEDSNHL